MEEEKINEQNDEARQEPLNESANEADMHSRAEELADIERQQAEREQPNDEVTFAQPILEALSPKQREDGVPLLAQEEIEEEPASKVNLTAVICTAIVAVCASVILLVAHPWSKGGDGDETSVTEQGTVTTEQTMIEADKEELNAKPDDNTKALQEQRKALEEQRKALEEQHKADEEKARKEAEQAKMAATLPVVKTVKVAGDNVYNNIRLIDASSRKLTSTEVGQMTKEELALSRNAIYAHHGYHYNNVELRAFFDAQPWFKADDDLKLEDVKITEIEVTNINMIRSSENRKK